MHATCHRILDGLVQIMSQGVAEISVPAVSRASGVSVPTIYRHFANKRALVEALPSYLAEKMGVAPMQTPQNPNDFADLIHGLYANVEALDDVIRAALISETAADIRAAMRPERFQMIEAVIAPLAHALDEPERMRLRNVLLVLSSSAVVRAFKDYLDLSWEEAADHVTWTIRRLIQSAANPEDET
ncbi:MAG: TetR/AcrR family transcriptional regulator [Chloroflexales bacterium]|nr:TetR/AcrR family transcriptional regulator [Chloroflexales bacterium]